MIKFKREWRSISQYFTAIDGLIPIWFQNQILEHICLAHDWLMDSPWTDEKVPDGSSTWTVSYPVK